MKGKLRLLFRTGKVDSDGKGCGYDYHTEIINVPYNIKRKIQAENYLHPSYEVVGGEWVDENDITIEQMQHMTQQQYERNRDRILKTLTGETSK